MYTNQSSINYPPSINFIFIFPPQSQKRNEEYEHRLARIHADSKPTSCSSGSSAAVGLDLSTSCLGGVDVLSEGAGGPGVGGAVHSRTMDSNSMQEFFDAEEYLTTSGDSTEVWLSILVNLRQLLV